MDHFLVVDQSEQLNRVDTTYQAYRLTGSTYDTDGLIRRANEVWGPNGVSKDAAPKPIRSVEAAVAAWAKGGWTVLKVL